MKQYKINTLDDMINCVNKDNLDNFIIDLKAFLEMYISLNELGKVIIEAEGLDSTEHPLKQDGFIWIDDGKHDYKIEFYKESD